MTLAVVCVPDASASIAEAPCPVGYTLQLQDLNSAMIPSDLTGSWDLFGIAAAIVVTGYLMGSGVGSVINLVKNN